MVIKNISKKTVLAKDAKKLESLVDKSLGLLLKSNPRSLFFETRFGIHTFFLPDAIDVLILDSKMLVKKAETISASKLFFWPIQYQFVIELPKGTIKKTKTKIGDTLKLEN